MLPSFYVEEQKEKFLELVTAGKGALGGHSCHLEQAAPLANTLSSESFSPYFSTGISFLPPTNRLLCPCFRGSRQLSVLNTQDPRLTSPGEGKQLSAFCSEPLGALSLLSLVSHLVQCTFWQATLAKYVRQPTVTV